MKRIFDMTGTTGACFLGAALALTIHAPAHSAHSRGVSILYSFQNNGKDGVNPAAALVPDGQGNYYGTTKKGGAEDSGTIFELSPSGGSSWKESIVYSFSSTSCNEPLGSVLLDGSGDIYATTNQGGLHNNGCVVELKPDGNLHLVYEFQGGSDGANPIGAMVADKKGNLYGTAEFAGAGCGFSSCGVVFEVVPTARTETSVYTFKGGSDGGNPATGLIEDSAGDLFGTTSGYGTAGYGTVFELTPGQGSYSFSELHEFLGGSSDGTNPAGALIMDSKGNLYGTTPAGGAHNAGTVYELNQSHGTWSEKLLLSFNGDLGGSGPSGGVVMGDKGALYGTTTAAGRMNNGVAFRLMNGRETVSHVFNGTTDPAAPFSNLISDGAGNLYGASVNGGASGQGTVFDLPD
jgi:uncharacterized repeat protein (TIGR03803 family)